MVVQEVLQRTGEPWRWGAQWLAIRGWPWPNESNHQSWSSFNYTRICHELNVNHTMVVWDFKKIGKVKKLEKCLMSWPKIKKKIIVLTVVFSYSMQQQWIISWSDWDVWWKLDFIWQPVMTSSMVGQRRSSKALPKAKLGAKYGHNHCLVICCPSDTLQLSKSRRNYYIWEVCSASQWDAPKTAMPAGNIGQQKGSNSPWQCLNACHTSNTSKVECIGLGSFASSAILTLPLTNQLPLLHVSWKLSAGKTLPQPSGGIRCFPRVLWIQKHGFLCYRNKQTYFSLAKLCWL